jgi:radical SAM protein with 4Fe4S-binding SPASM domain
MKKSPYLSLDEGSYFVKGPVRGAVYDLKMGIIYALDERMASLFSLCEKGVNFNQALKKMKDNSKLSIIIEEGLKNLDFVQFRRTFKPFPSISDILIKKGEDRQGVWLDVTQGCNLRCIHCYAEAGKPLENELKLEEWKQVVDELFETGYLHFTIGGGEPFFWKDILNLLEYILKKNPASICVLTNGTLLDDEILDFLSNYKIDLNITFFSYLREHHDKISGVKGSWERTLKGISNVIKRNIPHSINIPLGAYNQNDLDKTLDYLASIGVKKEVAGGNIVYPLGRGNNRLVLPEDHTRFNLKKEIYQLPLTGEERLLYQTCWCGKLLIKANGDVSPCPSARNNEFIVGNIRKSSLKEIVSDERMHYFWGLTLDEVEPCRDCEFRYGCHDCRANAYIYSGNLLGKNPYCLYDPKKGMWMKLKEKNGEEIKKGYWVKTGNYRTHTLDNELAILDEKSGAIHMLNQIGAEIYNLLDGSHSFEDLVAYILENYKVEEGRVRVDVLNVLKKFRELGIISNVGK